MAAAAKRWPGGGGASQEGGSGLPDEESQREQLVLSLCRRAEWARVEVLFLRIHLSLHYAFGTRYDLSGIIKTNLQI